MTHAHIHQGTCVRLTGLTFYEQPKCWQNFVLQHVPSHVHTRERAAPYVKEGLAPYGAVLTDEGVQFESHDLMWQWILTYG